MVYKHELKIKDRMSVHMTSVSMPGVVKVPPGRPQSTFQSLKEPTRKLERDFLTRACESFEESQEKNSSESLVVRIVTIKEIRSRSLCSPRLVLNLIWKDLMYLPE